VWVQQWRSGQSYFIIVGVAMTNICKRANLDTDDTLGRGMNLDAQHWSSQSVAPMSNGACRDLKTITIGFRSSLNDLKPMKCFDTALEQPKTIVESHLESGWE
jgi:hypothetical protein